MSADVTLTGEDDAAFLEEAKRRVAARPELRARLAQATRPGLVSALADAGEAVTAAVPEGPRLVSYQAQYDRWSSANKARCSWDEVKTRLLENGGEYLRRAEAMPEKGILFGADEEGNPLIANGGIGPVLTDRNYKDTREAVCFTKKDGRKVPTGYEMFNDEEEIRNFEDFTRRPFVQSPQDGEWRGSWLESGDDPGNWARRAIVLPGCARADLDEKDPLHRDPTHGVRFLLRVLKKS